MKLKTLLLILVLALLAGCGCDCGPPPAVDGAWLPGHVDQTARLVWDKRGLAYARVTFEAGEYHRLVRVPDADLIPQKPKMRNVPPKRTKLPRQTSL